MSAVHIREAHEAMLAGGGAGGHPSRAMSEAQRGLQASEGVDQRSCGAKIFDRFMECRFPTLFAW